MKKFLMGIGALLGLWLGIGVARADWAADERLKEKIESRIQESTEIKALTANTLRKEDVADIKVEVEDGVVTLSGVVRDRAVKHPYLRVARGVPDVKEVVDKIHVIPREEGAEDVELKRALEEKYAESKEIHGRYDDNYYWDTSDSVSVEVVEGVVTLRGIVKDNAAKEAYERLARETPGVQHVEVKIQVIPMERRTD